jgi:glycosyltransferase involved in cell wall biosynthesis
MGDTVSVVVATKDSLDRLQGLVSDFRKVCREGLELIVIDGASRDGTAEWLEAAVPGGATERLRWDSSPDIGIPDAWNRGVKRASGDWVLFVGADDRLASATVWAEVVGVLRSLPDECGVAAFPVSIMSPTAVPLAEESPRVGDRGPDLLAVNGIPHQGAFHRRRLWKEYGPFDTAFAVAADYEFLLRLWRAGVEIRSLAGPIPVAMTFGGRSKQDPLGNLLEFRRAQRKHGLRWPRPRWCRDWWFAASRHVAGRLFGEKTVYRWADRARRFRGLPPVWEVS